MKAFLPALMTLAVMAADIHAQKQGNAQPSKTTNRVPELDGKGSYVELPPNIFNDLEIQSHP